MDIELCVEIAIDDPQALDEIFEDWRLDTVTPKVDPLFEENQITIIWFSVAS